MRNLKKILALALALVMTFSLMATANAFSDSGTIADGYQTAAKVLEDLNVYKGQKATDGTITFNPKADITRAEVAAILYRIVTGDTEDDLVGIHADYNKFSDVPSTSWYAPYVNYCANAGLLKGVGGDRFNPTGKINGYSALAMILRAIGYGQNKEFEGSGWDTRTASTAQRLGMLQNVNQGTLGANASRELVAEIMFRGMIVPQVTYTPLLGYSQYTLVGGIIGTTENKTLGQEIFGLAKAEDEDTDKWGRPSEVWKWGLPVANKKIEVNKYSPVKTYTTAVDECDIYADAGLTNDTNSIVACWIDGVKYEGAAKFDNGTTNRYAIEDNDQVTSDKGTTIGQYDTTSVVGAQGRLTEVYKVNGGVWLVEINTYLAQVVGVNDDPADKNGHQRARTVDVEAWVATLDSKGGTIRLDEHNYATDSVRFPWTIGGTVETANYAVGDYVLVYINMNKVDAYDKNGKVTNVDADIDHYGAPMEITAAATPGVGGYITDWTDEGVSPKDGAFPATTTIDTNKTVYNDSDKFFVGWRANEEVRRTAYLDTYGNIIGFVVPPTNYLVIERIEWKHGTGIGGGYALADIVLADGTPVKDVTIATANGIPCNNTGDSAGVVDVALVSDDWTNNDDYYDHIFAYYETAEKVYGVVIHDQNANPQPKFLHQNGDHDGAVYQGVATIYTNMLRPTSNYAVANDATVFLVKNADGYSYTAYTGIDKVPTVEKANLCILVGRDGYAQLVLVDGAAPDNTIVAYVTQAYDSAYYLDPTTTPTRNGYRYTVYPAGTTRATVLFGGYDDDTNRDNNAATGKGAACQWNIQETGLYAFQVNGNNEIINMWFLRDGNDNATLTDNDYGKEIAIPTTSAYPGTDQTGAGDYVGNVYFDRAVITKVTVPTVGNGTEAANSFMTEWTSSGVASKDFRVSSETKVILVNGTGAGVLRMGSARNLVEGAKVIVGYTITKVGNFGYMYTAQYVYILEDAPGIALAITPLAEIFDAKDGFTFTFSVNKPVVQGDGTYDVTADITVYTCSDNKGSDPVQVYKNTNLFADSNDLGTTFSVNSGSTLSQGNFYYAVVTVRGTLADGVTPFSLVNYKTGVYQAQIGR